MRHLTREFYIPKGAVKVTPKDVDAVVYVYERDGALYAMAFGGKRQRPDFHYRYSSPQRREQAVREYLERLAKSKAYKDEQLAKRRGFRHGYKVGDILHYSWGYEQTNCEFFQIVSTTPGTVTMRAVAQETAPGSEVSHGMADSRVALKDKFLEKAQPITKRVQYSESGPGYISMAHGCASLWDGRPMYCSWYA
ncbi:MAG: hypothetical protein M3416_01405 [Acidobacteriota bacterium]|nr:hypothetical protein [Acidobacteriota bacterium]